jgi:hypothetical protein
MTTIEPADLGPHAGIELAELRVLRDQQAADLATATELLRRAADAIIAHESEMPLAWADDDVPGGIVADIAQFLAARAGAG